MNISAATDNDDVGGSNFGATACSLESSGSGRKYVSPLGLLHAFPIAVPNSDIAAAGGLHVSTTVGPSGREAAGSGAGGGRGDEAATPRLRAGGGPPRGFIVSSLELTGLGVTQAKIDGDPLGRCH